MTKQVYCIVCMISDLPQIELATIRPQHSVEGMKKAIATLEGPLDATKSSAFEAPFKDRI